jgi:MFS transporter, SP family, galactose:H+ symporter
MHRLLYFCVMTASLSGFLFGYQTAVIAGALLFLKQQFHLSPSAQGVAVSIILLGAMIASPLAGILADRMGRRAIFFITCITTAMGAWIAAEAMTVDYFLLGRFITGIGIGIGLVVAPMYLGEISPPRYRGTFISFYQLAVTLGILAAYLINLLFAEEGAWRSMIAYSLVPALIQLTLLPFICESPSWLVGRGSWEKAHIVCKKLGTPIEALAVPSPLIEQKKWKMLVAPGVRAALWVGLALSCFQQVTGINAVIYYAPEIFQLVGFPSTESALFATLGIGTINVLATFIAVWLLDRGGRKILLIIGLLGMMVSLAGIALAFFCHSRAIDTISAVALTAYVAFFAMSLGPVTWVILAEIYPVAIRGKAMGLASLVNWLSNYLLALFFLDLVKWLGTGGIFVLFACISLIALVFVCRCIPETKGKSIEEIRRLFGAFPNE